MGNINEKLIKKRRMKSLFDKRQNSIHGNDNTENESFLKSQEAEASILQMTENFEKDLINIEKTFNLKVDKVTNPIQIDENLFEKIKKIKHY